MAQEPVRTARIEARIAPDALAIVKRAAEIQGRSVSDFVVAAAQEAAQRTIERTEIITSLGRRPARLRGSDPQSAEVLHRPQEGSEGTRMPLSGRASPIFRSLTVSHLPEECVMLSC